MKTTFINKLLLAVFTLLILATCSKLKIAVLNSPPEIPSDPIPADNATEPDVEVAFSWICSDLDGDSLTYNIYLDTSITPAIFDSLIDTTYYVTDDISYNATYYWKIVALDGKGGQTEGPVWSFVLGDDETAPVVAVTSPNGGELYYIGSNHNISWEATDDDSIASYKLEFSPDDGTTWVNIETWSDGNPLIYDWEIQDIPEAPASTRYLVRLSCRDVAGNIASDVSDEMFTIWPEGGMIAFMSDRGGNYDIYTMWADGTHQRNITNSAGQEQNPSWSPDCAKIVFTNYASGTGQIYTMNSDGTDTVNISNNGYYDNWPVWSPVGNKIVFNTTRAGDSEIYTMNIDGSDTLNLTNYSEAADACASWSPDALELTFFSYRDGNYEIYTMDNTGGNPTRLTIQAGDDLYPAWSPDGSEIAFNSMRDGNAEIYLMNANGSDQHNISLNAAYDYVPQWSPDGTRLVFQSDRSGNYEIYVIDTDGTDATNISNSPSSYDGLPSWSPID